MHSSFSSLASFFHMGGYSHYVWPAYGVFVGVLLWQCVSAKRKLNRTMKNGIPPREANAR